MFYTLQGEAPFSGYPAVFLRLAGCNFGNKDPNSACQWCDTFFKFDSGVAYTYPELLTRLVELKKVKDSILVITGGEPTLQHNLIEFMELAQSEFSIIQIETNGTQTSFFRKLKDAYSRTLCCPSNVTESGVHVVCSPKGIYKAGKIPQLSPITLGAVHYLKFVVEAVPASPHFTVPEWAFESGLPIYVSPMAVYRKPYTSEVSSIWDQELIDHQATSKNYEYAAQYCMDTGCKLSVQTHLFTAIA